FVRGARRRPVDARSPPVHRRGDVRLVPDPCAALLASQLSGQRRHPVDETDGRRAQQPRRQAARNRPLQCGPEAVILCDGGLPRAVALERHRDLAAIFFDLLSDRNYPALFVGACDSGIRADLRHHHSYLCRHMGEGVDRCDDARLRHLGLGEKASSALVPREHQVTHRLRAACRAVWLRQ
ncbi:hypothetical protein NECAME_19340, partial [Necator americanus]